MLISNRIKVKNDYKDLNEDIDNELFCLYENSIINENYYNLRKKYIMTQHESIIKEDVIILQEANNKFLEGIISIFKKFINLTINIFDNFTKSMKKLKDIFNLYTNPNKVLIDGLSVPDNVYFEGYNYTLNTLPITNINSLTLNGPFTFNENIIKELSPTLLTIIEKNSRDSQYYDDIRGKILGLNIPISQEKYVEYIKKQLRDGKDKPDKILFSEYGTVSSVYDSLINHKDMISKLEDEKYKVLKIYKDLIQYFTYILKIEKSHNKNTDSIDRKVIVKNFSLGSDLSLSNSDNIIMNFDEKTVSDIKKYSIARSNEAKTISQLINTVFTHKTEAYKEKYKQDLDLIKRIIVAYK